PKALGGIAPGSCCIYLQHDPSFWRRALLKQHRPVPLMLAGHTHAMQLRLFGWSPAAWFYPEWGGLYAEGQSRLFVSTGIGSVMMPFRLGAWPEIDLLVLKSEP
ncbi:MAG: metallophosphoesterase, partial [Alloprevotella sp.]|nr:metallophosphoesterase [Alloprevotella sp.]